MEKLKFIFIGLLGMVILGGLAITPSVGVEYSGTTVDPVHNLDGFLKSSSFCYDHWSVLNVVETVTDLGGGVYKYSYAFTNTETSSIWHFGVWTNFSAGTTTQTTFSEMPTTWNADGHPITDAGDYDARNIDPNITWLSHTWDNPWPSSPNPIAIGASVSGFSYHTNVLDTSPKYYYYEIYGSYLSGGCVTAVGLIQLNTATAPVSCIVGGDRVVEAGFGCEAQVVLDGSCSSDADSSAGTNDDINDFDWYEVIDVCDPNSDIYIGSGEVIECNLGLGEHLIILEVTDKAGAFDSNEVVITVEDVTPPEFSLSVEPNVLWPPNGKMVQVRPEWEVSDNCDEEVEFSLVDITMSGPGNVNDYVQIGDDGSIYLRARKSKSVSGRVYTLRYEAVDDSGNATEASATVTVAHRRGPRRLGSGLVRRPRRHVYRGKLQRR